MVKGEGLKTSLFHKADGVEKRWALLQNQSEAFQIRVFSSQLC